MTDLHQNEECRILNDHLNFYSIDPLTLIEESGQMRVITAEMNIKQDLLYELTLTDSKEDFEISVGNEKQTFSQFIR